MRVLLSALLLILLLALVKTFLDVFIVRRPSKAASVSQVLDVAKSGPGNLRHAVVNYSFRQMEMKMLELINSERKSHWLESRFAQPLQWDESVAQVARGHSLSMARHGFMSHIGPDGTDPAARLQRAGVAFTAAGENVARGYRTIEETMAAFMNQPRFRRRTHRANILSPLFGRAGIGVVRDPNGGIVVTQCFAR